MIVEVKQGLLTALYQAYDELMPHFRAACRRECSACCTHNVLATTLEVDLITQYLEEKGLTNLSKKLADGQGGKRIHPFPTLNTLAEYCLKRQEPPVVHDDYEVLPCPLREQDGCPIYEVRPFMCRSMWSLQLCSADGEAVTDPVVLTLNGVFQQLIEHIDAGGLCGTLIDLFLVLQNEQTRCAYRNGEPLNGAPHLAFARPNPGFLVPPEHGREVQSALELLAHQTVEGRGFQEALELLHRRP